MAAPILPVPLSTPVAASGRIVSKVMQDVTVYLTGPDEQELEYLIDLYCRLCPADRLSYYKIAELPFWAPLAQPTLTASGRAAAAAGVERPYLEPVRRRIREGRAFELQLWDGRSIEDPAGSWSFNCRRIKLRSTGLHAFVRMVVPVHADAAVLLSAARALADSVALFSGHAGLAFLYDPLLQADAMDAIYAQARRFWGVDVEDLRGTLPAMRRRIKGVNWITIVGRALDADAEPAAVERALADLAAQADVSVEQCVHAWIVVAGLAPAAGDEHRPDASLDPYRRVASALEPLLPEQHRDFPGPRFIENGNTVGWIRRWVEPSGWR